MGGLLDPTLSILRPNRGLPVRTHTQCKHKHFTLSRFHDELKTMILPRQAQDAPSKDDVIQTVCWNRSIRLWNPSNKTFNAPNGDGIDIDSSTNALIRDSVIDAADGPHSNDITTWLCLNHLYDEKHRNFAKTGLEEIGTETGR